MDPQLDKLIALFQDAVRGAVLHLCRDLATADPTNWRAEGLSQTGKLIDGSYFFHGNGVAVRSFSGRIDFDFGHNGRYDGVSPWKLAEFAEQLGPAFGALTKWRDVEQLLQSAERDGHLKRPYVAQGDDMYYRT